MITNNVLLKIMTKLMSICQEFANFSETFTKIHDHHTSQYAAQKVVDPTNSPHKIRKTRLQKVSTEVQNVMTKKKNYTSFIKKIS